MAGEELLGNFCLFKLTSYNVTVSDSLINRNYFLLFFQTP